MIVWKCVLVMTILYMCSLVTRTTPVIILQVYSTWLVLNSLSNVWLMEVCGWASPSTTSWATSTSSDQCSQAFPITHNSSIIVNTNQGKSRTGLGTRLVHVWDHPDHPYQFGIVVIVMLAEVDHLMLSTIIQRLNLIHCANTKVLWEPILSKYFSCTRFSSGSIYTNSLNPNSTFQYFNLHGLTYTESTASDRDWRWEWLGLRLMLSLMNRVLEPVHVCLGLAKSHIQSCTYVYLFMTILYMCSRVPRTSPVLTLCFALTVLHRSGDQLKTGEDVRALMTVNNVVWTQGESRGGPTYVSICNVIG